MTVSTSTAKSGPYAGSGTTGPFTVTFRFLANSHLTVVRRVTSTGVETTLALNTDYSVSGAGGASGTVTLAAPLAVGQTLTIIRNVPSTQEADYVVGDAFPAESHELALDKLTMLVQQNAEAVGRSIKAPVSDNAVDMTMPSAAARARRYLSFDEDGRPVSTTFDIDAIQNASTAAVNSAASASVSATNAAASAASAANTLVTVQATGASTIATIRQEAQFVSSQVAAVAPSFVTFTGDGAETDFTLPLMPGSEDNIDVYINGVYIPKADYTLSGTTLAFGTAPLLGDEIEVKIAAGVQLNYSAASAVAFTPAGTGVVTRDVQAKLRETVSVKDFGAVGDGVVDDADSIRAGIDYLLSIGGGTLFFPDGEYIVGNASSNLLTTCIEIRVGENNISLIGQSKENTIVKMKAGTNSMLLNINTNDLSGSCNNIEVRNMTLDGNRANNPTGGYCIRGGGSISNVVFDNLIIKNSGTYGIGCQHGTLKDVTFSNLIIQDTGEDGVDLKNRNNDNIGLIFNNIVVKNFGISGVPGGSKTGLDIRGYATVSNVFCYGYGTNGGVAGIRWQGTNLSNGAGGIYCKAVNVICMPDTATGTQGLVIYGEGSSFESCSVIGAGIGFYTISENGTFENCITKDCTVGYLAQPEATAKTYIRGCQAVGGVTGMRLRKGSYFVSHSVCRETTTVGFLAEFDSTDVNLYFCETYPTSGVGVTQGGSGFVSFGSKTITNTRYDFAAPFSAGRSATQYILFTGDAAGNYVTGVSQVGVPKNLVIRPDANSSGLVLETSANADVTIRRNNVTKISATANSVGLNIPGSSVGLAPGELYVDGGFVKIA